MIQLLNLSKVAKKIQQRYYSKFIDNKISSLIDIQPNVYHALKLKLPVVALESTIITHGMPYPKNVDTALEVEDIVKSRNAIPATIAILNGRIKVGLSKDQLIMLAKNNFERNNTLNENLLLKRKSLNSKLDYVLSTKTEVLRNNSRLNDNDNTVNLSSVNNTRNNNNLDIDLRNTTVKTSRRDLAYTISMGLDGGTTVAGTLIIANLVGIKIFATGGIGGVHRNAETTMDISADLVELGKSPIAVVCSGVKSILDIPKTLEFLETQGVCVATYKSPDCLFPAFYTRSSGIKVQYNFNNSVDAAKMILISNELGLNSGILIGVPVPEINAMDETTINLAIEKALQTAKTQNITGKEITPFLLSAITEITAGRSLDTNMALIKNNASVAAEIAVEISHIERNFIGTNDTIDADSIKIKNKKENEKNIPLVIGGSILDTCITVLEDNLKLDGATYLSQMEFYGGGVGRNIAEGISKLYGNVNLISAVGNDQNGDFLIKLLPKSCANGIVIDQEKPTANCAVIFDKPGDCKLLLGDMRIHASITPATIQKHEELFKRSSIIVFDSNPPLETITAILAKAKIYNKTVFFEPTDMRIAGKPFELPLPSINCIKFVSPNLYELRTIAKALGYPDKIPDSKQETDDLKLILNEVLILSKFINTTVDNIIVTLGRYGVVVARRASSPIEFFTKSQEYIELSKEKKISARFYPTEPILNIQNVSGAGDSFISGFITAMLNGSTEDICVSVGFEAAKKSLQSASAVPKMYFQQNHECWLQKIKFIELL